MWTQTLTYYQERDKNNSHAINTKSWQVIIFKTKFGGYFFSICKKLQLILYFQ